MAPRPDDEVVEHTLYIGREVSLYQIPPRPGAGGHKSGDWKTADKIFSGRLRCVASGEHCEVRVEDPNTGDLYVTCPVPLGQRSVAVEPVSDSSRYFVLRVVDPTSNRHVFLGLGFAERGDAFDFNVALSDHEKQVQRARETKDAAASSKAGQPASSLAAGDVASLYKKQDLSLKDGETIKIAVKKPANSSGFMSSLPAASGAVGGLVPPPGSSSSSGGGLGLAPPPTAATSHQGGYGGAGVPTSSPVQLAAPAQPLQSPTRTAANITSTHNVDLLGLGDADPPPAVLSSAPPALQGSADELGALSGLSNPGVASATAGMQQMKPFGNAAPKTSTTATSTDSWASFD